MRLLNLGFSGVSTHPILPGRIAFKILAILRDATMYLTAESVLD